MQKTIFKQADSRWGSLPYPSKPYTLARSGCGCVAVTHCAIEQSKYAKLTPKDVRKYMKQYATLGQGTLWSGITKGLEHYGYTVHWKQSDSMADIYKVLDKSLKRGVILFGSTKGPDGTVWTSDGHFIAFTGYKIKDGKHYFYLKDSGGRDHDGWFCYEKSMKGDVRQVWICTGLKEKTDTKKTTTTTTAKKTVSKNTTTKKTVYENYAGGFPGKVIKKGSKGAEVRKWQKFLRWMGYDIEADGDFGKATKKYTKKAQKAFGFKGKDVDGVVGTQTITAAKKYKKAVAQTTTPAAPKAPVKKPVQETHQKPQNADIRAFKKVVDISYWQASADLQKAKKDGVDGVIIRTGYTSLGRFELNPDSRFMTHLNSAIKAGLPVGVYHYSQAISEAEAKKEAEYICSIIKPYKDKLSLPVVCDWEFGGRLDATSAKKLGKSGCTKVVKAFLDTVKKNGYTPMLYANYSALKNYLNYDELKKSYLIWLAQYNKTASLECDLWQYTSDGSISGIPGRVDVNKGAGVKKNDNLTGAQKAVKWALAIEKSGKYGYKKWKDGDAKTHQCPICHPGSGDGWNCIGFVTACYYHGVGAPIKCSCSGLGTDGFFTDVTLESWRKRNGKDWDMISNGGAKGGADIQADKLKLGDVLLCYDAKGKFHHIALYTGAGKYIDCTNTSKNHIAERPYTTLTGKYHVSRAFRYTA